MLRKLEKYEILDEIGHGGMATVYRARDSVLDRFVAVKVLHPHLQRAPEARSRFAREARSVARLRHPHILEIYDYSGEESDETYIAAELLTGPTLKDYVENAGEIPAEIAACFAIQIGRALSQAHKKGVIHRDVKPENVLIHEDECVKLTDFGIAHLVEQHTFTATGQILGSPGHMAPEQVERGDCDERSDIFSLGTVLYFVATGRLPFVGRNPHHMIKQLLEGEYPDPLRIRPAVGGDLKRIISRALQRDPSERYATAQEMVNDLEAFVHEMGIEDSSETLRRYLADPEGVTQELKKKAVPALLSRGSVAMKLGDIARAQDAYNRVLALDDGNQVALKRLSSLGRRERVRSGLIVVGIVLALVGASAFGVAFVGQEDAASPGSRAVVEGTLTGPVPTNPPATEEPAVANPPVEAARPPSTKSARPSGPRLVRFSPQGTQNVRISVNGAKPRQFGPDFNQMKLATNKRHTIRVIGAENCCRDYVDRKVRIPPGENSYALSLPPLKFKPAGVSFLGLGPADAVAEFTSRSGKKYRKKVREAFRVEMESLEEVVAYTVSADGFKDYSGRVTLRAGDYREARFTLEAKSETP